MTRRIVCVVCLATAVPGAGRAQGPGRPDSARSDTLRPHLLAPVIITGALLPIRRDRVGFGSALVSREELRSVPTAGESLNRTPGIWLDQGAGAGGPAVLRVRGGEEPYTQVLFDGVPININGGFLDLQGLTLTNVDRIEVARGPQSALYGSSAISGVVQMVTRHGEIGPPAFDFSVEGGRATERGGQARSELDVAGGAGALRYAAGGGVSYNRGIYALPQDLETRDGSLRIDLDPWRAWTLTGTFRYMDIDSKLPVRDPGVTRAPLDPNQRDGRRRLLSSLGVEFTPTPSWRHQLTATVFRDDFSYQDQQDGLDPTQFPFFVFDFNFGLRSVLHRQQVRYVGTKEFSRGATSVALSAGGEAQWEHETDDQTGDFGNSRTAFDRASGAGFAEIQAQLGRRVSLLGGGRLEHYQGLASEFLPRGALTLAAVPGILSLRAAAGRAFKVPNLQQQFLSNPFTEPNPNLRPETSVSWEVSAALTTPAAGLQASLGYFQQRYDNLIRTVALDSIKQTNENLGRTRSQGVELELSQLWSERLNTGANLTWVRTEVVDNAGLPADQYPVGGALPAVPAVTGNGFVDVGLTRSLDLRLRGAVVGRQTVFTERFAGARVSLDPYALFGTTLRWRVTSHTSLHLRVENLLNTPYATAFDRPGVPLTAVVGVRLAS